MTNEERARELAYAFLGSMKCKFDAGQGVSFVTLNEGIEIITAAFAEARTDILSDAKSAAYGALTKQGFTGARYCVIAAIRGLIDTPTEPAASVTHSASCNISEKLSDVCSCGAEPAGPDPTKALARFFQEWFECGTPNALAIKYGLVQIADRASQLELTDLGRAALILAGE